MNNQESMFAGQEQQHSDSRIVNEDTREQRQWQEAPPGMYMDPGTQQMGGAKLRPQQPLRPRRRFPFVPIVVIVLIILALSYAARGFSGARPFSASRPVTQTFLVTGAPTLIVSDPSGRVHIRSGKDNSQVFINSITHDGFGNNANNIKVASMLDKSTNTITVNVQGDTGFLSSNDVDLDISVPQTTNIQQLNEGSGSVEIDGISGQVHAQSGSGDIQARNLDGQITLHTGSGDVGIERVNGTVALSTGSGDINLKNASLSGQSTLHTGSGSIDFQGTLDRNGAYDFETGSGSIDVNLPANSAFHLETQTGSGSVDNEFNSSDVGSDPRALLTLKTGSGSIDIHKKGV